MKIKFFFYNKWLKIFTRLEFWVAELRDSRSSSRLFTVSNLLIQNFNCVYFFYCIDRKRKT